MNERRQDLGGKILVVVLAFLITSLLWAYFSATKEDSKSAIIKAQIACDTSNINSTAIAVLQEQFNGIDKRLTNIEGYTKEISKDVSSMAKDIGIFLKNDRTN
jgi:hypothetical protein